MRCLFLHAGGETGSRPDCCLCQKIRSWEPLGIDIEGEKGGFVPTAAWKEKKTGIKWYRGETLPVSIGQGYLLTTPLQLAAMTAGLATDGKIYRPHLVKRILDREGKTAKELLRNCEDGRTESGAFPTGARRPLGSCERATRHRCGSASLRSQGGRQDRHVPGCQDEGRQENVRYQFQDHALFIAFAPYDKPEIAVAVVVEHGEHGGGTAAPVAGQVLRKYFELKGVIKKPVAKEEDATEDGPAEGDEE